MFFHIICFDNLQFRTLNITCSAVIQVLPRSLSKLSSSIQCDSSMPPLLLYWMQSSSKVQDVWIKCQMYFHFLFYQLMMKTRHVNKYILKKSHKTRFLAFHFHVYPLPRFHQPGVYWGGKQSTIVSLTYHSLFDFIEGYCRVLLAYSDPTDRKNHFQITLSASSCKYQKNKKKF